jgi:Ca-activated chloride channel family protein
MVFEKPGVLRYLAILPILLFGLGYWGWRAKKEVAGILQVNSRRLWISQVNKHLLAGILMALLVAAMALPKVPSTALLAAEKTGEVAIVVDVSASMAARSDPESPSMLERVKPILFRIIDKMEELGDVRISFYGSTNMARSHVPFVSKEDYSYLRASINYVLDINSTPGPGSSLGRPILSIIDKFTPEQQVKLIVLISDGETFAGISRGMQGSERARLEEAITSARAEGIKVLTIGVGEAEGAKIPLYNAGGVFTGQYEQLHGADLLFYLQEEGLRELASRTDGRYFSENNRSGLVSYIEQTLVLAPTEEAADEIVVYRSVAPWFVLAALGLWVILTRYYIR